MQSSRSLQTRWRVLQPVLHRTQDWFAAIDLKDTYFHVSIPPRHCQFLRQGQDALAPRPIGVSGQSTKDQTCPIAEDLFFQVGAGLGHHDSAPLRRACSANPELLRVQHENSGLPEIFF